MSSRPLLVWLSLAGITLGLLLRPAEASPGATERVSVDSQGIEANGRSTGPSISTDGRYVAFTSSASNLVDGDNAEFTTYHAFLKDRVTGEVRSISRNTGDRRTDGVDAANIIQTMISDDGRFVAFNAFNGGARSTIATRGICAISRASRLILAVTAVSSQSLVGRRLSCMISSAAM